MPRQHRKTGGPPGGKPAGARRFQILPPAAHCRDPGCTAFAVPGGARLDQLIEAALDHRAETGHAVAVVESSQVIYGPPGADDACPA